MNIKNRIKLIRNLLYLQEVIRNGTITHTAEQNGIKPSNLSYLLSDLEDTIGCQLLKRNSRGILPTPEGLKIYNTVVELEATLEKLETICRASLINQHELKIYISQGLELPAMENFHSADTSLQISFCAQEENADICILNHKPENKDSSYTQTTIGNHLRQNIWISANENHPAAMEFFDFIIAKMLF